MTKSKMVLWIIGTWLIAALISAGRQILHLPDPLHVTHEQWIEIIKNASEVGEYAIGGLLIKSPIADLWNSIRTGDIIGGAK